MSNFMWKYDKDRIYILLDSIKYKASNNYPISPLLIDELTYFINHFNLNKESYNAASKETETAS